jgi:hypothetical protein
MSLIARRHLPSGRGSQRRCCCRKWRHCIRSPIRRFILRMPATGERLMDARDGDPFLEERRTFGVPRIRCGSGLSAPAGVPRVMEVSPPALARLRRARRRGLRRTPAGSCRGDHPHRLRDHSETLAFASFQSLCAGHVAHIGRMRDMKADGQDGVRRRIGRLPAVHARFRAGIRCVARQVGAEEPVRRPFVEERVKDKTAAMRVVEKDAPLGSQSSSLRRTESRRIGWSRGRGPRRRRPVAAVPE